MGQRRFSFQNQTVAAILHNPLARNMRCVYAPERGITYLPFWHQTNVCKRFCDVKGLAGWVPKMEQLN